MNFLSYMRLIECTTSISESGSVVSDSLWQYNPWNTDVGNLYPLQGIFSTQGLISGLAHCRLILYQLSHPGSPRIPEWVAYPFSSRSSWPRNQTGVFCIVGGFFTGWTIREVPKYNWIYLFLTLKLLCTT